eukprot:GCRY01001012.1.p1 GENE.GCRY01001012.1~~GCRY01001012.1.p1  ORF type:complete len:576 (+),score=81.78 GCRY01001012.1:113-1840(+)
MLSPQALIRPRLLSQVAFPKILKSCFASIHGKRSQDLLWDPRFNKGSFFDEKERGKLGLRGLLPQRVTTLEEQVHHSQEILKTRKTPFDKYLYLSSLQDRNEALYYAVLESDVTEYMPIVYTPTVGEACIEFSRQFRYPRGLFISKNDRHHMSEIMNNIDADIKCVVVTDGERILGLGDQGVNGAPIPNGKLSLYTVCGGLHPSYCLPITLDVGTNGEHLQDPSYLGIREKRITGDEYYDFIDDFIASLQKRFGEEILIQFEDFGNHTAFKLLEKYRNKICCFNDDIQGTAAVALSGLLSSTRLTQRRLVDEKILFFGAGEAGIGIGNLIVSAMKEDGLSEKKAMQQVAFVDSKGLVCKERASELQPHKLPYAHPMDFKRSLLEVIKQYQPTTLVGVSGNPQTFTEEIIREMNQQNAGSPPVIMALSNPTSKSECTAEQAYSWSQGRAIFCSGSPFPSVEIDGKTFSPGQGNNSYIFPGLGMGVVSVKSRSVTDSMFYKAALSLSSQVTAHELAQGSIYPQLDRIRAVSLKVAAAVAEEAFEKGLARIVHPGDLERFIASQAYNPEHHHLSFEKY